MSSDSLYLSRFSGTAPSRSGSNPKSLHHTNTSQCFRDQPNGKQNTKPFNPQCTLTKTSLEQNITAQIQNSLLLLPRSWAVKVRRPGLARHPVSWHDYTAVAAIAGGAGERNCGSKLRFGGGEESGEGGGGHAAARQRVGSHECLNFSQEESGFG